MEGKFISSNNVCFEVTPDLVITEGQGGAFKRRLNSNVFFVNPENEKRYYVYENGVYHVIPVAEEFHAKLEGNSYKFGHDGSSFRIVPDKKTVILNDKELPLNEVLSTNVFYLRDSSSGRAHWHFFQLTPDEYRVVKCDPKECFVAQRNTKGQHNPIKTTTTSTPVIAGR